LTKLAKVRKCFESISFAEKVADLFTFALTGHPCHFQGHYHLWIQGVGWPSCLRLWRLAHYRWYWCYSRR
jgi:hypothetical protein